jgi:hypothetical protein
MASVSRARRSENGAADVVRPAVPRLRATLPGVDGLSGRPGVDSGNLPSAEAASDERAGVIEPWKLIDQIAHGPVCGVGVGRAALDR